MSDGSEHYDRVKAYIKACEGVPDTIQPRTVKALADALDNLVVQAVRYDIDPIYIDEALDALEQYGREPLVDLRLYHGGEG